MKLHYHTLKIILSLFVFFFLISSGKSQNKESVNTGKRPSVGLVMSGGGAKGFAYIGILKTIQKAGLRIDYVAGTSMGSIVAGLYAAGYHPDSIQKIIYDKDWEMVLADEIPREEIAYEEKEFGGKFILSLPFRKKKISMMASLHEGQEVDQILNYYLSPVYNVHDFNDLNVPFLCIGTDLLTGEAVEINSGYLPSAIKASMSIPGYFSPTEYDGRYLVDGGVVDNYPVIPVKNQGIDIIIGADVQSGLKTDIEDLQTVTSVIDQIISFYRVDANEAGYAKTNLYIPVPMDYGMMEFTSYDSIIAVGDRIGNEYFDEIKALADSLNEIEYRPLREYNTRPLDSIYIDDVIVEGNEKMPDKYFSDFIDDFSNKHISPLELRERITSIYGTKFFSHVNYKFKEENGKTNLHLIVTEAEPGYLSTAVHYDFDYQASVLANITARNVLGKRSKLFADIVLGSNPRLKAMYSISNSKQVGAGAIADLYTFTFNDYIDGIKSGRLEFSNYSLTLFGHKMVKNKFAVRLGVTYEYFKLKQDVVTDTAFSKYEEFSSFGTAFMSLNLDSYNKHYYPTRGALAEFKIKYTVPWSHNVVSEMLQSSVMAYLKYDHNIPILPHITFRPGLFLAATMKQDRLPPIQHWIGVGGLNPVNYVETHVDFTGVNFVQSWGFYTWILRGKLQYEVIKDVYVIARADAGINTMEFDQLNNFDKTMFGYGLTASYNSFIGPVEVTMMGSNINEGVSFFVNIGFWL